MARIEVKSLATKRFWLLLHSLPVAIQDLAKKNYALWCRNPSHPSLRFRRLSGSSDRYTVRIGDHYRALAQLSGDTIVWVWIGTHSEYDRLVGPD